MSASKSKRRTRKKTTAYDRPLYSQGQINAIIDDLLHPLKRVRWIVFLIDEALHMANEGDIVESAGKFLEYSLPEIVRELRKKRR